MTNKVNTITFNLSPWWVTGITDSEGNFSIYYNKNTKKITFSYKVTQKYDSIVILYYLKNYFGDGIISIDNSKFKAYKYTVTNTKTLIEKIIPHFDKYSLVGSKKLDYLDWKKAITLSNDRLANANTILYLKAKMNTKRSFDERWNYLNTLNIDLKPEWLQAFIEGEGTFQCRIGDYINRDKNLLSVAHTLEIAQNSHDVKVLEAIKLYFGHGYLKPKYDIKSLSESKKVRSVSRFITYNTEVVTKFIDAYPMYTRKKLDYLDWKKIIELKSKYAHKDIEGKQQMIDIKLGMNRGRILNSSIFSANDKLKAINFNSSVRCYHTKIQRKNEKYLLYLLFLMLLLVGFLCLITYYYGILICLKKTLCILFFFFLTTFYLDEFKLPNNIWIKYFQIIIFVLFFFYIIMNIIDCYIIFNEVIYSVKENNVKDIIESKDIVLKGKVVLDKDAGTEVAKGLSNLGSNIGLGACVGALAGGVAKGVAKTPLLPFQKAGLIVASGVVGAILHTGASAINAQTHAASFKKSTDSTNTSISDNVNKLINFTDYSPLEILVQCIYVLNSLSIWILSVLFLQILFKFYISDRPNLSFINIILPSYSDKIKEYVYKLIKLYKKMSLFYIIFAIILLLVCLSGSTYFISEIYNNLDSYVDVHTEYKK